MNHERESTYLLIFKFECVECGCLGVCDAKPGKGFSPSPYQLSPSSFTLWEFTYKTFSTPKNISKNIHIIYRGNPQPSLLKTHSWLWVFPPLVLMGGLPHGVCFITEGFRRTSETPLVCVSVWKERGLEARSPWPTPPQLLSVSI